MSSAEMLYERFLSYKMSRPKRSFELNEILQYERGAKAAADLQGAGPKVSVETLTLDVTDDASIAAAVRTIDAKFGCLDVLVNNAGLLLDRRQDITTRELLQESFAVNTFGPALLTEA